MRLYVPAIGDRLTLTVPWEFGLYLEHRNSGFALSRGLIEKGLGWSGYGANLKRIDASLPEGTVLECDRVYIRTFNKARVNLEEDYDSITWKVIGPKGKPIPKQRFWVKLPDCYSIEYDPDSLVQYRDRVKLIKQVMSS